VPTLTVLMMKCAMLSNNTFVCSSSWKVLCSWVTFACSSWFHFV